MFRKYVTPVCMLICVCLVIVAAAQGPSGEGTVATPISGPADNPAKFQEKAAATVNAIYEGQVDPALVQDIVAAIVWREVSQQIRGLPNTEEGKTRLKKLQGVLNASPEQKAETYSSIMRGMHTVAYQDYEGQRASEAAGKKLQPK